MVTDEFCFCGSGMHMSLINEVFGTICMLYEVLFHFKVSDVILYKESDDGF